LMYGKEASNRKQEIDRQHHTIPNQRPKDKQCGNVHNRLWNSPSFLLDLLTPIETIHDYTLVSIVFLFIFMCNLFLTLILFMLYLILLKLIRKEN
ncbi:hypothetical protein AALB53_25385, partial [Lachnospiraceae bacterium 47-T17]